MEVVEKDGRWFAKKNKKAKTTEDITDIVKIDGDFCSVMGRAGRTEFHSYLGKIGTRWVEMHGVTSLLNYWGEKERLLQWAVDRAVDYIAEAHSHNEVILKDARSAHRRSLKEAGDHGTDKHALVEELINYYIDGIPSAYVSHDEQIDSFIDWAKDVKFLAAEMPLRSRRLFVAGTCDFICEIDGKRYIGDLKTSNYVKFVNFLQCAAYALFYEEMGLGKIDGIVIAHMPRTGGFKIHTEMGVDKYKNLFESLVRLVKADKEKSYQLYN